MAPNPFSGVARKVVIPLIILSAVGWVVYVVGLALQIHEYEKKKWAQMSKIEGKSDKHYCGWAAAVVGPVAYIALLAHAALWKQLSSLAGSITAILFVVYLVGMGGVLCEYGALVYQFDHPLPIPPTPPPHPGPTPPLMGPPPLPHHIVSLQFAGSLIACFFGALILAVWPWYSSGAPRRETSLASVQ